MEQAELFVSPPKPIEVLTALLPPLPFIRVGKSVDRITSNFERSVVVRMFQEALDQGYAVDRTNGDAPLEEWDGWLCIHSPLVTFIQIAKPGGGELV